MGNLFLVGYGTLLYRASLGDTIGSGTAMTKQMRPVLVQDYRRLFNLRPTHYESSSKLSGQGIENAAMNVERAAGSTLNGLAFEVNEEELRGLDERERYYRRSMVTVYDFETHEAIGEGAVYEAELDAPWLERDISKLLPFWRDIVWARAGSYAVSDQFGRYYDATTFLADGQTLMIDHYKDLIPPGPPGPEMTV